MTCRRSREGAWIEIALSANYNLGEGVAPVRERGLKSPLYINAGVFFSGRSREGAWIEIKTSAFRLRAERGRSREGAWIEIKTSAFRLRAERGRSREGAWIEIH